ncbi:MAG: tripartite tricarboxylate transporter substrate binding protein [Rhodoferax sp.]|nr:tripartite tricarboxylate transporter substrate binding protein [Rhodoferax sp.]
MKKITRRTAMLATGAGLAAGLAGMPTLSMAEDTWRIVVPFAAGGSNDLAARMLAKRLGQTAGATVIVENQAGANGNIGAAAVARAPADGTTMLLTSDGYATVNPLLFKDSMKFAPDDLLPIAVIGFQPALLVVNANSPMRTFGDLLQRGRSGDISYSSGGVGSAGHLTMAYLGQVAQLKMTHVPHTGGAPAMNALLGGHVDAGFVAIPNALPHVRTAKLRALAVSSPQRLKQLPDIPTVAESGYPGFQTQIAALVAVPSGTPVDRRERLSALIRDAVRQPEFQSFLDGGGFIAADMTAAQAATWVTTEAARWHDLIVGKRIVAP